MTLYRIAALATVSHHLADQTRTGGSAFAGSYSSKRSASSGYPERSSNRPWEEATASPTRVGHFTIHPQPRIEALNVARSRVTISTSAPLASEKRPVPPVIVMNSRYRVSSICRPL